MKINQASVDGNIIKSNKVIKGDIGIKKIEVGGDIFSNNNALWGQIKGDITNQQDLIELINSSYIVTSIEQDNGYAIIHYKDSKGYPYQISVPEDSRFKRVGQIFLDDDNLTGEILHYGYYVSYFEGIELPFVLMQVDNGTFDGKFINLATLESVQNVGFEILNRVSQNYIPKDNLILECGTSTEVIYE